MAYSTAMARVRCFLVHSDGPFFATSQVQLRRAKALGRVEDAAAAASAGNARPVCLDTDGENKPFLVVAEF